MLVKKNDFYSFLTKCKEENLLDVGEVILPYQSAVNQETKAFFTLYPGTGDIVLDGHRSVDPAKMLFYLPREKILPEEFEQKKKIIAGVKACDLQALALLDKALINDDFIDPSYKHWRDNTYIISADCTSIADSCHCSLVEGKPYAVEGFDLNLSTIDDRFMLISGSRKGDDLISIIKENIDSENVTETDQGKVKENRDYISSMLEEQNARFRQNGNESLLRGCDNELWQESSKECIGCGACTNICSTCYCLILNDETESEQFIKVRSTDSCQYNGYARVAGGGTPRPKMYQRFRNRYLCKFDYMKSNFNEIGCTGCGRCIDACPANIDLREVIHSMHCEQVSKSEQT